MPAHARAMPATVDISAPLSATENGDLERPQYGWQVLQTEAAAEPGTVERCRELMVRGGDFRIEQDPIWLIGEPSDAADVELVVYRQEDRVLGFAPVTYGTRLLRFAIGEFTLYAHRVNGATLIHQPAIAGGVEPYAALQQMLDFLARRLGSDQALFFEGVPVGSPLAALLTSPSALRSHGLYAVELGQPYLHCFAKLPRTFREYEEQLGTRSRRSLRYSHRKLLEHLGGALRVQKCTAEHEVDAFVAHAQAVSQRTYQWQLLGLGLRDTSRLSRRLKFAARHGWLRSYLLWCRDEPCAFMVGYQYQGTYFYIDVGYDPSWAAWSVGSVLQMEVMRDLLESEHRPRMFDFSTGAGSHKQRFGNAFRREANFLLLHRRATKILLAACYRGTVRVDAWLGRMLDKHDLKRGMKKWLRRALMG